MSPPSSARPRGAASEATRARDPSRVRRYTTHAERGDYVRCARSRRRRDRAPCSSVRRLRPPPPLAARARAAPHSGGRGRRGACSARGTARGAFGAHAIRPCGGAARVAGGARSPERPPLASRVSLRFFSPRSSVCRSSSLRARRSPRRRRGAARGALRARDGPRRMWRTRDPGRAGSPRRGRSPKRRAPSSRVFFSFLFYFFCHLAHRAL